MKPIIKIMIRHRNTYYDYSERFKNIVIKHLKQQENKENNQEKENKKHPC
jgi:hypothetical protein